LDCVVVDLAIVLSLAKQIQSLILNNCHNYHILPTKWTNATQVAHLDAQKYPSPQDWGKKL